MSVDPGAWKNEPDVDMEYQAEIERQRADAEEESHVALDDWFDALATEKLHSDDSVAAVKTRRSRRSFPIKRKQTAPTIKLLSPQDWPSSIGRERH